MLKMAYQKVCLFNMNLKGDSLDNNQCNQPTSVCKLYYLYWINFQISFNTDYDKEESQLSPQHRQRNRIRTVFTESQVKQLDQLFSITDYPTAEARAQLARSTGLSEETVRVRYLLYHGHSNLSCVRFYCSLFSNEMS